MRRLEESVPDAHCALGLLVRPRICALVAHSVDGALTTRAAVSGTVADHPHLHLVGDGCGECRCREMTERCRTRGLR